MSDIAKCNGERCKIRDICYRYRAAAGEWQSFIIVDKVVNTADDCGEYWKLRDEQQIKELDKIWQD